MGDDQNLASGWKPPSEPPAKGVAAILELPLGLDWTPVLRKWFDAWNHSALSWSAFEGQDRAKDRKTDRQSETKVKLFSNLKASETKVVFKRQGIYCKTTTTTTTTT